jgi:cell division protein ZapE
MTTPLQRYQRDLQRSGFSADAAQKNAVQHLQRLFEELTIPPSRGYFARLRNKLSRPVNTVRGLYFWGGVGRGKTYLVDSFYDCIPDSQKMRVHFHRFMQHVHHELRTLPNVANPLQIVADRLAGQTRVLCLDEFHVSDITDAMLLGGLLKALFERGVTLVATSNVVPDELYKNGLQRDRFLPAIALLKNYTEVVNVDSGTDYRLRVLEQAEIYHSPLDAQAERNLSDSFFRIAPDEVIENQALEINARFIKTRFYADGIVWFDFLALCDIPRAVADYIELAQCFNTVLLSNIPCLQEVDNDKALRLINLVDEFYDRNVKLIISAAAPPESLYVGTRHAFAFQRTISRLQEMGSHEYLERPHLP